MIYPQLKVFPVVCLIIFAYFVYHGIRGAHGYLRLKQVQTEIELSRQVADEVHSRRLFLELKVKSLSDSSLDMDQLEESALHFLSMARPEGVVLLSGTETK